MYLSNHLYLWSVLFVRSNIMSLIKDDRAYYFWLYVYPFWEKPKFTICPKMLIQLFYEGGIIGLIKLHVYLTTFEL